MKKYKVNSLCRANNRWQYNGKKTEEEKNEEIRRFESGISGTAGLKITEIETKKIVYEKVL